MTKDDIRNWSNSNGLGYRVDLHDMYERLFSSAYQMGVEHEREACAKLVEVSDDLQDWEIICGSDGRVLLNSIAEAIRARGQA